LITSEIIELIRDGTSVAEIMSFGPTILPLDALMEGVARSSAQSRWKARFPDGTKLVIIHLSMR
jgi:urease gamma subunit